MVSYNWDKEFKRNFNQDSNCYITPIALSAVKSCIEADEPYALADVLGVSRKAHIYALLLCFTQIPSVRCIEHIISQGVSLTETFEHNPFRCSPQEYLEEKFSNPGPVRALIYKAIERGKSAYRFRDHSIHLVDEGNQLIIILLRYKLNVFQMIMYHSLSTF